MDVEFFSTITVEVPRERIFARLGYAKGITQLSAPQQEHVERSIEAGVSLITLQGCYRRLLAKENDEYLVVLAGGLRFRSQSLGHMLAGCEEAMLMSVTAGSLIVEAIHANAVGADMSSAVVFDAVASEMVESGLNWITELVGRELMRERRCFTERRFSAGYGDLIIQAQKDFYTTLRLDKLGVTINESYMLVPEKTVTAIIGIRKMPEPKAKQEGF